MINCFIWRDAEKEPPKHNGFYICYGETKIGKRTVAWSGGVQYDKQKGWLSTDTFHVKEWKEDAYGYGRTED